MSPSVSLIGLVGSFMELGQAIIPLLKNKKNPPIARSRSLKGLNYPETPTWDSYPSSTF